MNLQKLNISKVLQGKKYEIVAGKGHVRDEMTAEEVRKLNVEYTQDSHHILKKGHLNPLLSSNPAC